MLSLFRTSSSHKFVHARNDRTKLNSSFPTDGTHLTRHNASFTPNTRF